MTTATLDTPIKVPDEFTIPPNKSFGLAAWSKRTGIPLATLTSAVKARQLKSDNHPPDVCAVTGANLLYWVRQGGVEIKPDSLTISAWVRHSEAQQAKAHQADIAGMDREAAAFDAWGVYLQAITEWVTDRAPTVPALAVHAAIAKLKLRDEDLLEHRAVFLKVKRILGGDALDVGELGRLRSEFPHVVQAAEKLFTK